MNIATLLPFILIIGVMFLMTRSAKNKQRQAAQMRDQMQPGSGVRTIGGMIARVKEVRDTTVLLEIAPGVHSIYAKTAIGAVLSDEEYDRVVHNDVPLSFDEPAVDGTPVAQAEHAPEAAEAAEAAEEKTDLGKPAAEASDKAPQTTEDAADGKDTTDAKDATKDAEGKGK